MCHNFLGANIKIATIKHAHNLTCPRCGVDRESLIHALRDCAKAREVLLHWGIDGRILNSEWTTGVDWLESSMRMLDQKARMHDDVSLEYLERKE